MRWTHQYVQGEQLTQQYLLKPLIQPMLAHFLAHDVLLKMGATSANSSFHGHCLQLFSDPRVSLAQHVACLFCLTIYRGMTI